MFYKIKKSLVRVLLLTKDSETLSNKKINLEEIKTT